MKLLYDKGIKLAGIGQTPWQRFGPQNWFENYAIVSQDKSMMTAKQLQQVRLYVMPKENRKSGRSTAALKSIITSDWFKSLQSNELRGYSFLTYRPVDHTSDISWITNSADISSKYENKASFRDIFRNILPFPPNEIISPNDNINQDSFSRLNKKWGDLVVQDESLSGGTGTFIVKDYEEFKKALEALKPLNRRVVISQKIQGGRDASVQCCATKYGIFVGPVQEQIISSPLLSNSLIAGGEKFNGVQIDGSKFSTIIAKEMKSIARKIGAVMSKDGFSGIYSIDFFMDIANNNTYVLEVNPRMTGVTPLYNIVQANCNLPLPLLHILEVGGFDYTIEGFKKDLLDVDFPTSSMLVLRSKNPDTICIDDNVKSGTYLLDGRYLSDSLELDESHALVQTYVSKGTLVAPGDKIAIVFVKSKVSFSCSSPTTSNVTNLVEHLYSRLTPV